MQKRVGWILLCAALLGLSGARDISEPVRGNGTVSREATRAAGDINAAGVGNAFGPQTAPPHSGTPASAPPQDASWTGQVQENIRKAEYNITWQDDSVIPGEPGGLHAANRANNLRAYFREDGVQIVERESSDPEWDLRWRFTACGRAETNNVGQTFLSADGKENNVGQAFLSADGSENNVGQTFLSADGSENHVEDQADRNVCPTLATSLQDLPLVTPEHCGNRVEYAHDGITEWYENKETGLEHGFTIHERPTLTTSNSPLTTDSQPLATDNSPLILTGIYEGSARGCAAENADSVHFNAPDGREVLRYAKLEATDAQGRHIPATMSYADGALAIQIEDKHAVYPIEVDPIYVPPPPTSSSHVLIPANQIEDDRIWEYFGFSISGAGDVNGDGYADVLVGAPVYDNGQQWEGATFLYLGSPTGLSGTNTATAAAQLEGNKEGAFFGACVSSAGDVNGDGYADVIVGAASVWGAYDNGQTNEGAAFLFLGSPAGLIGTDPATAATALQGNKAHSLFGWSVSDAGDVNGDGYADVIVGAPGYTNGEIGEGAAILFLGSPAGLIGTDLGTCAAAFESNQTFAEIGTSVSGVGDINGDGYADVLIGAPVYYNNGQTKEGVAFLFLGSPTGLIGMDTRIPDAVLESNQWNSGFGSCVSGAGDVNGDGFADVLVGAPYYDKNQTDEGSVFLFLGSPVGLVGRSPATAAAVIESNQAAWTDESNTRHYSGLGFSLSGAGDVNGDGFSDVLVGAYGFDTGPSTKGAAFLFLGSPSGLIGTNPATAAAVLKNTREGADFGTSVSGAGDVNGDGFVDVIVGQPFFHNSQSSPGSAFLFFGSSSVLSGNNPATAAAVLDSDQSQHVDINGDVTAPEFGWSVSGAGDVNGDGYADVIIGAPCYDNGQFNEGAAFLFLGSSTGLIGTDPATAAAILESNQRVSVDKYDYPQQFVPGFGWSVSGAGDVNGDGYSDVIVGAPYYNSGQYMEGAAFLFLGSPTGLIGTDPTTAAAVLESNLPGFDDEYGYFIQGPAFGYSVSGAGDVNGDGYADVLIGAPYFHSRHAWEGAAFLFLGSPAGLIGRDPASAAVVLDSNQAGVLDFIIYGPEFGTSVAGAGDVNGDGYADVIIGAPGYSSGEGWGEGAAFLFLGSSTGLAGTNPATAATVLEGNQFWVHFGQSVSGAGDVNGDSYGDVLVGAPYYYNGEEVEGAAFLFLGSPSGLLGTDPATAASLLEGNRLWANFGRSVSGAGDVTGDGFADVVVGLSRYDNGETKPRAICVFLGSPSGLIGTDPETAAITLEGDQTDANFGSSVSGTGDVNGDGYADVIVGANGYDNGQLGEGSAFLFYGNSEGVLIKPELRKNNEEPLAAPGISAGGDEVRLSLLAHSPPERPSAVRLEWEIKPYGVLFDGQGAGQTTEWVDPGMQGHPYDELILVPARTNGFRWRMRVLYAPLNLFDATGNPPILVPRPGLSLPPNPPHSRWYCPQWATVGPSDFRTSGYRPPTDPENVQLSPGPFHTTDEIVCIVGVPSISPAIPPENNQQEYVWTSETGREIIYHSETPSFALPASDTRKGETWTCTVWGWDGSNRSFRSAEATTSEVLNTPPGQPVLSLPDIQGKLQNLICQVVQVAPDPDVDEGVESVRYNFEWYVKHVNDTSFTLFRSDGPSTALSSQINNLDTAVDDLWYCVVTPMDNESTGIPATTGECTIVLGGVEPSYMALGVNVPSITLGQAVTLSGQILPIPLGSGTVTFESVSPSGVVTSNYPEGAIYASGYFSRTCYPNAASEDRAAWSVTAQWPGDNTYRSAASLPVGFEVLKAQPELAIALSQPSALVNLGNAPDFSVTATFSVPGFPSELRGLYEGRTIRLSVADPAGQTPFEPLEAITVGDGRATFGAQDFLDAGISFAQAGVWKFKAEFAGDEDFKLAATADFDDTDARLTAKAGAGYAILVVGRLDGNAEGHAEHAQTAEYIYDVLRSRGFGDDDIQYLREYLPGEPDRGIADGLPTKANLAAAIEGWAKDAILGSPAPLYIILLDHGSLGRFHMDETGTPELEYLTPQELSDSLDLLQSSLGASSKSAALSSRRTPGSRMGEVRLDCGLDPGVRRDDALPRDLSETAMSPAKASAAEQDIVVMYGACHSGSFIPALSGAGRVVIASSAADENSYRGEDINPDDGLDVRNGEFFLTEFFRNAASGKTLKECFELASSLTFEYTAARSNGADANLPQHPELDDNGDGAGTSGMLSSVSGEDGARVRDMDLGLGANAGTTVSWFTVSPPVFLDAGGSIDTLTAETTGRALAEGDRAWLEIKTPEYDNGEAANPAYDAFQRVAAMAGPILAGPPQAVGGDKYQYAWSQADLMAHPSFGGFITPGTYKVYYFLRDGQTNQVSSYLVTNIYVAQSDNTAPDKVTLQYPLDGAEVSSALFFVWGETADPDGNGVTYRLEVSEDGSFDEATTIIRDGITGIFTQLTEADGIADLKDYHWRVFAVDEYGAQSEPSETRAFHVDNNNGILSSAIIGTVTDARTGAAVAGATASVFSLAAQTLSDGSFCLLLSQAGEYNVKVAAPGYVDGSAYTSVSEGGIASVRIRLTPVSDAEGEGQVNIAVPLVVSMTQANAEIAITSAGLTVGTVSEAYNDSVVAGDVMNQTPPGGTLVARGSAVDLVVSRGPRSVGSEGEVSEGEGEATEGEEEAAATNKFLGCGTDDPAEKGGLTDAAVLFGVLLFLMSGARSRHATGN